MAFGRGTFTIVSPAEHKCKSFAFNPTYRGSDSDVRVQLGLHEKDAKPTYEAAVSWVEKVTVNGFQACVATSGPIAGSRTVSLQWMAFVGKPSGSLAGIQPVSLWTTGTKCKGVDFIGKVGCFIYAKYLVQIFFLTRVLKCDVIILQLCDIHSCCKNVCKISNR